MSGGNSQVFSSGESLAVTFSLFFLCSVKARLLPQQRVWLFLPDILTEKAWLLPVFIPW
jgi:hypothetical protein